MTTARDVIESALRLIRVQDPAESASSDQAADGLQSLNDMLASWNTEPLMLAYQKDETLTLTGARTYTVGPGGDLDTTRPQRITNAYIRSGGIDYPVQVVSDEFYSRITNKSTTGRPEYLHYDAEYPLGKVELWPVGDSSYTLYLTSWKQMPEFTNLSDTITLPPGYLRAIRYNLALELAPEYGAQPSQVIVQRADQSKRGIKRINTKPPFMPADAAVRQTRRTDYSIYSDSGAT